MPFPWPYQHLQQEPARNSAAPKCLLDKRSIGRYIVDKCFYCYIFEACKYLPCNFMYYFTHCLEPPALTCRFSLLYGTGKTQAAEHLRSCDAEAAGTQSGHGGHGAGVQRRVQPLLGAQAGAAPRALEARLPGAHPQFCQSRIAIACIAHKSSQPGHTLSNGI